MTSPARVPPAFPRLPKPELTLLVFLAGTVLALSPMGTRIDLAFEARLVSPDDGWLYTVMHQGLDRLSSQRVIGVLLVATALWFAWRRRDLTPIVIAALAESGFLLAGVVKVLLGKSATILGTPTWWGDGPDGHGKFSMAYPSGHATEAVLLWGTLVLLLALYAPGWTDRATRIAARCWVGVIATTVLTSWAMHRHWVSDLAAGLVFGLVCLKLVVGLVDRRVPDRIAGWLQREVTAPGRPADPPSGRAGLALRGEPPRPPA